MASGLGHTGNKGCKDQIRSRIRLTVERPPLRPGVSVWRPGRVRLEPPQDTSKSQYAKPRIPHRLNNSLHGQRGTSGFVEQRLHPLPHAQSFEPYLRLTYASSWGVRGGCLGRFPLRAQTFINALNCVSTCVGLVATRPAMPRTRQGAGPTLDPPWGRVCVTPSVMVVLVMADPSSLTFEVVNQLFSVSFSYRKMVHVGAGKIAGTVGMANMQLEPPPYRPPTLQELKLRWIDRLEERIRGKSRTWATALKDCWIAVVGVFAPGVTTTPPATLLHFKLMIQRTGNCFDQVEGMRLYRAWASADGTLSFETVLADLRGALQPERPIFALHAIHGSFDTKPVIPGLFGKSNIESHENSLSFENIK